MSLEALAPDQRAVVSLVLQQGRSYADLAGLLGMPVPAVRDRALRGLAALVRPGDMDAGERAEVADYLLGQGTLAERDATRDLLRSYPDANAWAVALVAELVDVPGASLPDVPAVADRYLPQPTPVTVDEVPPEEVTPDEVMPEERTPEERTPEDVPPEDVPPEDVTPEDVTPEPETADSMTPEPATAEPVTPETATPEPATPVPVEPDPATTTDTLSADDGDAPAATGDDDEEVRARPRPRLRRRGFPSPPSATPPQAEAEAEAEVTPSTVAAGSTTAAGSTAPPAAVASESAGSPRSSRLGGALLLLVAALVVIALVVFLLTRGSGDDDSGSASAGTATATSTTPSPTPTATATYEPVGQVTLGSPTGGKAKGRMVVFVNRSAGTVAFTVQGTGLAPNTPADAYAVWLTGGGAIHRLGFNSAPVTTNGRLGLSGPRAADQDAFQRWFTKATRIVVSLEKSQNAKRPSDVVLAGRKKAA